MLRDNKGARLFRRVDTKIVFPDAIFPDKKMSQHAEAHQGFNSDGVDEILMQIADQLETLYPWWQFKMVELKPEGRTARYIFKFAGYRSTKITPNDERTTLGPEPVEVSTPTEVGTTLAVPLAQE